MRQKLKQLGCYLIIIILLPYVVTVFLNGPEAESSVSADSNRIKAEHNGKESEISIEEYCIGKLAKEIPVSYKSEALKAQAVLVRTVVY